MTFGPGVLPTYGTHSINQNLVSSVNSPTNYAGQSGSINAPPQPPGVPGATNSTTPMMVTPLDASGTTISIVWDTAACTGNNHIVYGRMSCLPSGPGRRRHVRFLQRHGNEPEQHLGLAGSFALLTGRPSRYEMRW